MAHVLEIGDAAYQALVDAAQESGTTPEELLEEWLLDRQRNSSPLANPSASEVESAAEYDPAKDPLAPFLGAFKRAALDLAARHDHYLAEAYADTHASK